MITVAEYNQVDQIKPWESVWNHLLDRTPEACFSQTLDRITARNFGEKTKPRILMALVSGRPFGILPLKVETQSTPLGTMRVLTGLSEPWSPFAGPLGPNTTAMLTTAFRHLHRTRRDWDIVEFRVPQGSELLQNRLRNAFRLVGWDCEVEPFESRVDDGPYDVRSEDVPFPQNGTHATRRGFRYTHVSPWAFRARWTRFRKQIQSRWKKTRADVPEISPCPGPHRLSLYVPTPELQKTPRPHALP